MDAEWAERIREAVQHLPNKWPEVERAEVGIAVRESAEPNEGKFVIFLPTEMATGTGTDINGRSSARWTAVGLISGTNTTPCCSAVLRTFVWTQ